MLEDFHTLGRIATSELAEQAAITAADQVLDAGSGIGGTARFLADTYGCRVEAIDMSHEYCEVAEWLNQLVGLDTLISVRQGDVTALPFGDEEFQVVISQHVQMNIPDKRRLYQEARRVLVAGGRLAIWDIIEGKPGPIHYPLPWADQAVQSHLETDKDLRGKVVEAGFEIAHWKDLTEVAAPFMQSFVSAPPGPFGLHTFVHNFVEAASNLTRGLANGRLRVVRGVAVATAARRKAMT
jgi:sarcosine/dimethylglycine N-methyltransferase